MYIELDGRADSCLRRLARKNGYVLSRFRARLGINNCGGYRIVDPYRNSIVAGEHFDLDGEDVADWIGKMVPGYLR